MTKTKTAPFPPHRAWGHEEWLAELRQRFGDNPMDWAFTCPRCGDVATGMDFAGALKEHPRTHQDGSPVQGAHLLAQECIGRTLGALTKGPYEGRGCDWAAYGLFRGPHEVRHEHEDGSVDSLWCFPMADAPSKEDDDA